MKRKPVAVKLPVCFLLNNIRIVSMPNSLSRWIQSSGKVLQGFAS